MSITHDSFVFTSNFHGDIIVASDFEPEIVQEKFFGVLGETHNIGAPGGRDLTCEYMLTGYNTPALLGAAMVLISSQVTKLTGTVTLSGGNLTGSFANCTFLGYRTAPRFVDGSGVNGWCVAGQLLWRQRKP